MNESDWIWSLNMPQTSKKKKKKKMLHYYSVHHFIIIMFCQCADRCEGAGYCLGEHPTLHPTMQHCLLCNILTYTSMTLTSPYRYVSTYINYDYWHCYVCYVSVCWFLAAGLEALRCENLFWPSQHFCEWRIVYAYDPISVSGALLTNNIWQV